MKELCLKKIELVLFRVIENLRTISLITTFVGYKIIKNKNVNSFKTSSNEKYLMNYWSF